MAGIGFSPGGKGAGCCCGECAACDAGYGPQQIQVTVAGIAEEAPPDCGNCDDLNGDYILTLISTDPPAGDPACQWRLEFDNICGDTQADLIVQRVGADVNVLFTLSGLGTFTYEFEATYSSVSSIDCDFVAEVLNMTFSDHTLCSQAAGPTATLNSL